MYYYCNKLIPSVEYLGNVCNNFKHRNYYFYSTFLYNSYINKIKSTSSTIPIRYNNKFNSRKINTLNNYTLNDVTINRRTDPQNNDSYDGLYDQIHSYGKDCEPEDANKHFDDIDKVLDMIKTGNVREIDEYIFESVDKNVLSNLDKFSISDINNLLHMSLKVFYSQNLIEALILKLKSTHPSEIPLPTLALIFQSLGRVLPCDFRLDRLEEFLQQTCDHLLNVDFLTESHFSSIVYGFQRLHYNNHDFLRNVVKRYEGNLTNFNINSVTISLSSLVKLNYYNLSIILKIYKHIYKSMNYMNLQTSIQLSTTIYKIHEYYFTDGLARKDKIEHDDDVVDEKMKGRLYKFNYKLMNNILKNVCEQHLKDLSLFQVCLLLDSMNRMSYRKITYISKLVQCIPSHSSNLVNQNATMVTNVDGADESESKDLPDLYDGEVSNVSNEDFDGSSSAYLLGETNVLNGKCSKQRNLYSYMELPECPFNYIMTLKRLKNLDPCHLILISHSIFGLDYYNEYTLNLLLVIKDIINPILHELKARHILLYMLSYINIYFTNYQLQRIKLSNELKSVSRDHVKLILKSLDSGNFKNNWFNKEHLIDSGRELKNHNKENEGLYNNEDKALLKEILDRINRCEWKEDLVLSSFENLFRHSNFIKSSQSTMNLFKLLFLSLIHNVYIPTFPQYFNLASLEKLYESNLVDIAEGSSAKSSGSGVNSEFGSHEEDNSVTKTDIGRECMGNMVLNGEIGENKFPALIPENIIAKLYDLYTCRSSNLGVNDVNKEDDEQLESSSNETNELEAVYKIESDLSEHEQVIRFENRCVYLDKRIHCFKVDVVIYNI